MERLRVLYMGRETIPDIREAVFTNREKRSSPLITLNSIRIIQEEVHFWILIYSQAGLGVQDPEPLHCETQPRPRGWRPQRPLCFQMFFPGGHPQRRSLCPRLQNDGASSGPSLSCTLQDAPERAGDFSRPGAGAGGGPQPDSRSHSKDFGSGQQGHLQLLIITHTSCSCSYSCLCFCSLLTLSLLVILFVKVCLYLCLCLCLYSCLYLCLYLCLCLYSCLYFKVCKLLEVNTANFHCSYIDLSDLTANNTGSTMEWDEWKTILLKTLLLTGG